MTTSISIQISGKVYNNIWYFLEKKRRSSENGRRKITNLPTERSEKLEL